MKQYISVSGLLVHNPPWLDAQGLRVARLGFAEHVEIFLVFTKNFADVRHLRTSGG